MSRDHFVTRASLVDPDPAVDILNILVAVASLASIGSFTTGIFDRARGRRKRRVRKILEDAQILLRQTFASLKVTYQSILALQEKSDRQIDFQPGVGLRVGQRSMVEPSSLTLLNRRRQQLIEECGQIQRTVLRVQERLKSEGQVESPTYDLFEPLKIEINTIIREHEKYLGEIEHDVLSLLQKADGVLAELQRWLAESNQ
jgi:hypothetical protein